ncbi:hypothetical protein LXM50_05650 [Microbacterium sp. Au-Mic1]|uniref:hypothetical protein n=1 Tax=Microbacterium sp. Au-Mic1 TaxID=2906457 RepID=UPI001E56F357|nr:hypothetical protein [Microbacterium sp. Au-Mic1]MCE4025450.1 hypothetical protein [Microbacterium sp. Au-Mic1]
MFTDDEWMQLVRRLMALTDAGRLEWIQEPQDEDMQAQGGIVVAPVGAFDYVIGSVDRDDRPPFYLGVGDREARKLLARLESTPARTGDDTTIITAAELVPELRERALRSASGASRLFSNLIEGLNGLEAPF